MTNHTYWITAIYCTFDDFHLALDARPWPTAGICFSRSASSLCPPSSQQLKKERHIFSRHRDNPVVLDSSNLNVPSAEVRTGSGGAGRGRGGGVPDHAEATLPRQGRPSSDARCWYVGSRLRRVGASVVSNAIVHRNRDTESRAPRRE